MERRCLDGPAVPLPSTCAGRVEAAEFPTRAESLVDDCLVAATNDDLDIVMLTSRLAQPQVDRPATGHGPPHPDLAQHFGNGDRGEHPCILAHPAITRISRVPADSTFDFDGFIGAVNGERRRQGLTWYDLAAVLWEQSAELNARRNDHPY